MHGSLHLILAHESARARQHEARDARRVASTRRRPFARFAARVASAHGVPPRAAPGTDSRTLGQPGAASLRAR